MDGAVTNLPITVVDPTGKKVRTIEFGPAGRLDPDEVNWGVGIRDLWDVSTRFQVDLGLRIDGGWRQSSVLAPRFGLRYLVDKAGRTTVRASLGRYAGRVPLAAKAFGRFPARRDSFFDPVTGAMTASFVYGPVMGQLPQPRADALALEMEHRLTPTVEVQVGARRRVGSKLPTVVVPEAGGPMPIVGMGTSEYHEVQVALRKIWAESIPGLRQLCAFVVAWRSRMTLARSIATWPRRFWTATPERPRQQTSRIVCADGPPSRCHAESSCHRRSTGARAFRIRRSMSTTATSARRTRCAIRTISPRDLTAFKTFDIFSREMDFGLQLFNLTAHENPRDVVAVVDSPRYGQFSASFGVTLAGYMQIRW